MIILILIVLGFGCWGGWRIATWLNKKQEEETLFYRRHIEEMKTANRYWFEQSHQNKEIQNSTVTNHNNNLHQTLQIVLTLLEKLNKTKPNEGEKESIETIIKTIKGGINSSHVE